LTDFSREVTVFVGHANNQESERASMASIRKEISTSAQPEDFWAALSDLGALHTRLVPGFVIDTKTGARCARRNVW
jgi:hypothetical protein